MGVDGKRWWRELMFLEDQLFVLDLMICYPKFLFVNIINCMMHPLAYTASPSGLLTPLLPPPRAPHLLLHCPATNISSHFRISFPAHLLIHALIYSPHFLSYLLVPTKLNGMFLEGLGFKCCKEKYAYRDEARACFCVAIPVLPRGRGLWLAAEVLV